MLQQGLVSGRHWVPKVRIVIIQREVGFRYMKWRGRERRADERGLKSGLPTAGSGRRGSSTMGDMVRVREFVREREWLRELGVELWREPSVEWGRELSAE